MSNLLLEDFEDGTDGATVTTSNTDADFVSGGPVFTDDWAADGSLSMLVACSGTTKYARWPITSSATLIAEFFFSLVSIGTTGYLCNVLTSGSNKAQIRVLSDRTLQLRNGTVASSSVFTGTALTAGSDYRAEWHLAASTQTLYVYTPTGTTPVATVTADYTGGAVNQIQLGNIANATITYRVDSLNVDTNTVRGPLVTAPTVDAGDDVSTDVATKVSIDATITNGSGTQAWTRVSGPTVSFSAASSVDTDVTNTGGAGTTVLQLTDGSGSDTVSITWLPLPLTAGVQGIESAGDWTDTANLLDDDPDTVATITNASSDALGLRMKNMAAPTGDITVRLRGVVQAGTHSVDISLRKHDKTTVVKSVTGTTVTDGTVEIPIDAADITSMGTDWSDDDGWGAYLVVTATGT